MISIDLARSSLRRASWVLGLGALVLAALPGCLAHASGELVYDYPAQYVEPPPRVEYYPSVYYRGAPAYLVEGRWYYRTRDRWIVFRDEPAELREYRVRRGPAYLAPRRDHSHVRAERRIEERRQLERARHEVEQRRAEERRRAEQYRRAEEHRRHERARQAEQRRQRFEEQRRASEQRAAERREHDRRSRHARDRDHSGDDERGQRRGERDRRQFRHD